ncbi:MAG: hypothetical protein A2Y10_01605 [Planctomycetes bacterium GWF2_41_51]|nr:MAG: hypothetical protein A2Y10_01605 [Planctomycetes bacterium GWF2_41_51]HBG27054.1 hypothetical protein [Phycisphaerales bacterium]
MQIFETLKKDHKKVLDLLEKLEHSSQRASKTRHENYLILKKELLEHMHGEENTFYKFLLENEDLKELLYEAYEEHRTVRLALPDLEAKEVTDEQWKPILSVIGEMVKHHINEEEKELFKEAKSFINHEDDERLVSEFEESKKEAGITV